MWISNFILASLLASNLKVGGSVLNDETSFGLQFSATLFKDNIGNTVQTTKASQDSLCMYGHNFVNETKIIVPQNLTFAKMKQAIELNIALESISILPNSHGERFRGGSTFQL